MKSFWKNIALILLPLLGMAGSALAQASYSLLSPEARRIATALSDDPSRAVRERAAFILQRNAEASSA